MTLNACDLTPRPKLKMGLYAGIGTVLVGPATLLAGLATPFMLVAGDSAKIGRMWHRVGSLVDYQDMHDRVQADPFL